MRIFFATLDSAILISCLIMGSTELPILGIVQEIPRLDC